MHVDELDVWQFARGFTCIGPSTTGKYYITEDYIGLHREVEIITLQHLMPRNNLCMWDWSSPLPSLPLMNMHNDFEGVPEIGEPCKGGLESVHVFISIYIYMCVCVGL